MNDWPFFNCPKCKALYHVVEVASGRKILAPRPKIVEAKVRCSGDEEGASLRPAP
jgi:hypothetical protein